MSHWMCMRMLLMTALVRSMSSLTRWLSLNTIMFARPSSSVIALEMRDTSSRRESWSVRRWCTCESKGGCAGVPSWLGATGGYEAGGKLNSEVRARASLSFGSSGSVTGKDASLALAGYSMLVMLVRPSSRMPTLLTKGSIRASLRSMRACCSRKCGAIVAMAHDASCRRTSNRVSLKVQPTMAPWQDMICLGQSLLTWLFSSSRSTSIEHNEQEVRRFAQLCRWCSCEKCLAMHLLPLQERLPRGPSSSARCGSPRSSQCSADSPCGSLFERCASGSPSQDTRQACIRSRA